MEGRKIIPTSVTVAGERVYVVDVSNDCEYHMSLSTGQDIKTIIQNDKQGIGEPDHITYNKITNQLCLVHYKGVSGKFHYPLFWFVL